MNKFKMIVVGLVVAVLIAGAISISAQETGDRGKGGGGDFVVFDINGVVDESRTGGGGVIDTEFIILGAVDESRTGGGSVIDTEFIILGAVDGK